MSPLSIGLDLGGTHIRAVAFDDELAAVARAAAPTAAEEGVESVVARMAECVRGRSWDRRSCGASVSAPRG